MEINIITSLYCKMLPITLVSQHNNKLYLSLSISLILWCILLPKILKTFWSLSANYCKTRTFLNYKGFTPTKYTSIYETPCVIWYYLYNLKKRKNTHGGVLILESASLLKLALPHGCFSRSFKALHINYW